MLAHTNGCFAVYSASTGKEVTPRGRKARALLAFLLSHAGTKMPKVRLAALLWGDRSDRQARCNLRQALVELRRALNRSYPLLFSDREHVWIACDTLVESPGDTQAEPRQAFEDLDNISPEFDEWLAGERGRRSAAMMATLKANAAELLASGRAAEASIVIDQIQALDACDEEALCLGMRAAFQCKHPAEIVKQYEAAAVALKTELGVEPSSETRGLKDSLLRKLIGVDRANYEQFNALYEAAEQALNMGAWEYDLVHGHVCWTPGTFALFGIPVGSPLRRQEILEQYEPESRSQLEAVREEAIRKCTGFALEVDIFTRSGNRKRLRINAAVESRGGTACRVFGTKQLVSQTSRRS